MQADKDTNFARLGPPCTRNHRPHNSGRVFSSLDISSQPKHSIGYAAGQVRRSTMQDHRLITRVQHAEGVYGTVPQYPRVLAVTAALHRDHGTFSLSDTHQPSRNRRPSIAGVDYIGAQHHASRIKMTD